MHTEQYDQHVTVVYIDSCMKIWYSTTHSLRQLCILANAEHVPGCAFNWKGAHVGLTTFRRATERLMAHESKGARNGWLDDKLHETGID